MLSSRRNLLSTCLLLAFAVGCGDDHDHDHSSHDHHDGHDMSDMGDVGGMCEGDSSVTTDGLTFTIATTPEMMPLNELFTMTVSVVDADGTAVDGSLSFDATMPAHGHGMNVEPTIESADAGTFTISGINFHMPGTWKLDFSFETESSTTAATLDYECTEG